MNTGAEKEINTQDIDANAVMNLSAKHTKNRHKELAQLAEHTLRLNTQGYTAYMAQ
jgi:hypothetical protein